MDIKHALGVALRNLQANKIRCAQMLLGMVIGVASAVVILYMGSNLMQGVSDFYSAYSPSLMYMGVYTSVEKSPRVTVGDMEGLIASSEYITAVSPLVSVEDCNLRYNGETLADAQIKGVSEQFLQMKPACQAAAGRFLQPLDISRRQKVCVIGSAVAEELLGCQNFEDALGQTLKIRGENFTVIGVLAEIQPDLEKGNYESYIPYTTAKQLTGEIIAPLQEDYYLDIYYVNLNSVDNIINGRDTVRALLAEVSGRPYGETTGLFSLSTSTSHKYDRECVMGLVGKLLGVSGIVLLVGGVGIMNVMLAAVSERRREIGIRKAFGANNPDIRRQFMLEAFYTSGFGALLGVLIGMPAGWLVCQFMGSVPIGYAGELMINPDLLDLSSLLWPAVAASAAALLLGVLFGYLPARKAEQLEIVDCMRE